MQDGTLRRVLAAATRDLHETLDREIGAFGDVAAYGAFLSGSHAFRAAIEPQLAHSAGWRIQTLAPLIAQDLADLGLPVAASCKTLPLPTPAARAAACYVLEGSALGARLLARRAAGLGFAAGHGARHLAEQTASPVRWKQFLAWLEAGGFSVPEASAAARDVFGLALRAYGAKAAA
ncbi:biliverdin-producing heme oxygenase [Paracoccus benzoatiresistens]|uniref:Biliverdin-producing heme oxygenase n=1 Tax=Paracoccus benzoatiresistens TaxID=2997341 RepID=A0ABT4IZC8_9RHOB|nr:biliverdin-producing heme oxygenase [Paracoccus sp. EF6]MCZ0960226.1 biliverdin-producing heme oxygenase [Paracoccus sp. EF6]